MNRSRFIIALCLALLAPFARAYVDITPSLGRIVNESRAIVVIQVEKVSREKRGIIFSKISDIKGDFAGKTIKHQLTDGNPPRPPRHLLDWARPGQRAVMFIAGPIALICTGDTWYQTSAPTDQDAWCRMSLDRPELALAYRGSTRRLAEAVKLIADGKEAIITTVTHGAQGRGSFSDVVFNTLQSGAPAPMQRIRASRQMPPTLINMGADPQWFVGLGAVTADDFPRLAKELESTDSQERLEAADDFHLLGTTGGDAVIKWATSVLDKHLIDSDAIVRLHVAAALLTIDPQSFKATTILKDALSDPSAVTRLEAARSAGRLTKLPDRLIAQLVISIEKETDADVRWAAIESLGTCGPAAAGATATLEALLDQPEFQACAAEALGRIGAPAKSSLSKLAKLLDSTESQVQWAAALAMVLIGGKDAKPAVPFLVARLEKAPRGRELYQLTWLLGLLGPVADDAVPALQNACFRDNELATMAIWAIRPRERFPWQLGYWADRQCDLWLFADYIDRMGPERTKGAALDLMESLLNNRAGRVPSWGYHLLTARAESTVPALIEALKNAPASQKQRAAKLLGIIGLAAASAKPALEAAATSSDRVLSEAAKSALEHIVTSEK